MSLCIISCECKWRTPRHSCHAIDHKSRSAKYRPFYFCYKIIYTWWGFKEQFWYYLVEVSAICIFHNYVHLAIPHLIALFLFCFIRTRPRRRWWWYNDLLFWFISSPRHLEERVNQLYNIWMSQILHDIYLYKDMISITKEYLFNIVFSIFVFKLQFLNGYWLNCKNPMRGGTFTDLSHNSKRALADSFDNFEFFF